MTNSCQGYDWTGQTTHNSALEISDTYKLPLQPKISTNKQIVGIKNIDRSTYTSTISKGAIGVAVMEFKFLEMLMLKALTLI